MCGQLYDTSSTLMMDDSKTASISNGARGSFSKTIYKLLILHSGIYNSLVVTIPAFYTPIVVYIYHYKPSLHVSNPSLAYNHTSLLYFNSTVIFFLLTVANSMFILLNIIAVGRSPTAIAVKP